VTKGDTLYGLARKYGTTVTKIKSANGMSGDMIRLGQKVKIP
jgi:LysM repeat protein